MKLSWRNGYDEWVLNWGRFHCSRLLGVETGGFVDSGRFEGKISGVLDGVWGRKPLCRHAHYWSSLLAFSGRMGSGVYVL
jgi:hypothetical protein